MYEEPPSRFSIHFSGKCEKKYKGTLRTRKFLTLFDIVKSTKKRKTKALNILQISFCNG